MFIKSGIATARRRVYSQFFKYGKVKSSMPTLGRYKIHSDGWRILPAE